MEILESPKDLYESYETLILYLSLDNLESSTRVVSVCQTFILTPQTFRLVELPVVTRPQ